MTLSTDMTALTSLFTPKAQQRAAHLVMALLLVYIAYVSANITWSVFPQAQNSQSIAGKSSTKHSTSNQISKSINVAKIQSLNLFGQYDESSVVEEVEMSDVPETKLNLTLSGLVASDDKSIAAAIIENQGKQETYGIGDIIIGTRANLEQVLMDRVIIKQSGRLETLMLDGFDYNQPAQKVLNKPAKPRPRAKANTQSSSSGVIDHRANKALSSTAKNLRNELAKDPAKIGDYLRISPKRKEGKIVGYSLRPGKKPDFFKLAGLKAGDVAVEMNGYDLVEPKQAMQAMIEMKQAKNISLLVNRQDSLTEILISLE